MRDSLDQLTAGDLRRALEGLPDDTVISFEGGLTFSRLKRWSDKEQVVIFGEILVDMSPAFKRRNPNISAAFYRVTPDGSD